MMILDGMFDNTLFMNKDNSNLEDYKGNYLCVHTFYHYKIVFHLQRNVPLVH